MLRNILAALVIMAFVGCAPSYASDPNSLACQVVYKASSDVIKDYQAGKTQFDVFRRLNKAPMTYWYGSDVAKVYTQSIVIDLRNNVRKGYRAKEILDVVVTACKKNVSSAS